MQFEPIGGLIEGDPENGIPDVIERGWSGRGWIFQDFEAFDKWPDHVCYIPEFTDDRYTARDFLRLARGQEEIAREMFEGCARERPEEWLEQQIQSGRVIRCRTCETLYYRKRRKVCPYCGREKPAAA